MVERKMTMTMKTNENCGCEKTKCCCDGSCASRCKCGDDCRCEAECRCGNGCGCACAKK